MGRIEDVLEGYAKFLAFALIIPFQIDQPVKMNLIRSTQAARMRIGSDGRNVYGLVKHEIAGKGSSVLRG